MDERIGVVLMDFRQALNTNVPVDVQQAIIDIVTAEYGHTHAEVDRRYEEPEARDAEPHIRRVNIESALLQLPQRFPGTVSIRTGTTARKNSFRFVVCGNLVFTQSYVEPNRRVPREAVFRNSFAGDPNQMRMSPKEEAERVAAIKTARDCLYCIVTHAPTLTNYAEAAHVTVVFVDGDCRHLASIDLVQNVALLRSKETAVERVDDRRHIALRKDVKKKRGASA